MDDIRCNIFKDSTISFRLIWIGAILLCNGFCLLTTISFWERYLTNPTVISLERDYLDFNFTFPPITLCLKDRLNKTAMREFLIEKHYNETQIKDPDVIQFFEKLVNIKTENLREFTLLDKHYFEIDEFLEVSHWVGSSIKFIEFNFQIMMRVSNKIVWNTTFSNPRETIR